MFIDMHCHSVASDDARATAEAYLKWIQVLRKKGYQVDGVVLTEHRQFHGDADYAALAEQYGVTVLRGSELDTRYGHVLVYGVNQSLLDAFDFSDVQMDTQALLREARASGAFAVPAHPGRFGVGLVEHMGRGASLDGVEVIELLNHGNRPGEGERAALMAHEMGLLGIGGSDAHFPSAVGACLTEFLEPIATEAELVAALTEGRFRAVRLEDTMASGRDSDWHASQRAARGARP